MKKELLTSLKIFLFFTIILGFLYPLFITGIAQITFKDKANGSLIEKNGQIIGSSLIGQDFSTPEYFHPRYSANNYDALSSGGTNYGPSNKTYIELTKKRLAQVKKENNLNEEQKIPADMVLSSSSGLDPHISVKNAKLQANRVAKTRKIKDTDVLKLVRKNTEKDFLGIWGEERVNVLKLNLDLDNDKLKL